MLIKTIWRISLGKCENLRENHAAITPIHSIDSRTNTQNLVNEDFIKQSRLELRDTPFEAFFVTVPYTFNLDNAYRKCNNKCRLSQLLEDVSFVSRPLSFCTCLPSNVFAGGKQLSYALILWRKYKLDSEICQMRSLGRLIL